MKRNHLITALLLIILGFSTASAVAKTPKLISWIATDKANIGSNFTGTRILILGGMSQPGQIIIELRSPDQKVSLKLKTRQGPFWLGSGKTTVAGAPGIFQLLASAPRHNQLTQAILDRNKLSNASILQATQFQPRPKNIAQWQAAFLHLKQERRDYVDNNHAVTLVGGHLFFSKVILPTSIPLGNYQLGVYLTRNGHVVAHQTHDFVVHEVSLERWVTRIANNDGWLFGLIFVPLVGFLGLVIGLTLRRIAT